MRIAKNVSPDVQKDEQPMPAILIDTNLLIYLYDPNQPDKQKQSERVLEQLELTRSGRLSVQALAEFFSVATRKLSPSLTSAEALDQVTLFTRLWPVFDLTSMIVMEAGRGVRDHKLSYYDAQVWATARLNQVPVVFSEDFRDGSILEGIRFVNPFSPEFLLEKWL
jgi:predicted nucleic acid-binding protein